jgi:prepilin-type N-terminal cleavage/methylation domain-containing protein
MTLITKIKTLQSYRADRYGHNLPHYSRYEEPQGFTLIELLLVIVLISVLSGLVLSVINVSGVRARGKDAQRAGDLKRIQTALELYYSDYRGYPVNSGGWDRVLPSSGTLNSALSGDYIQVLPSDPMDGTSMTGVCSMNSRGYYYRTDTCSGAGCLASKYVIMTFMESPNSVGTNECNDLANCVSGSVAGCSAASCASPCYGVENPL